MRAAWVTPKEAAAGPEDLRAEGIAFELFDPLAVEATAARWRDALKIEQHGDVARDRSNPKEDAALAKEADEHAHVGDEVRLFVEGQAVYDVLANDGVRWLRLWVGPGDAIRIPARRYHRVLAPPMAVLRYVELFADAAGLLPLYRVSDDATRAV